MMNVSSLAASPQMPFSLDTQSGIADLLAAIRVSDIESAHKNELRDLVFLYTNGGKDQTVRLSLEQKISAFNLKPNPKRVPAHKPLPPSPVIGSFRNAPSFSVPPAEVAPKPAVEFTKTPAWKPAPVVVEASSQVAILTSMEPARASHIQPAPELIPEPELAALSVPIVSPTVTTTDQTQYLDRIRTIKAAVNAKVGNPVNLVDINNEVGREYMGALLDAMKKLNTGSSAVPAMQRLEAAYVMVEETLRDRTVREATVMAPSVASVPTPSPIFEPEPTMPQRAPEPFAPPMMQTEAATDQKTMSVMMPVSIPVQSVPVVPPPAPPTQFEQMQAEVPRAPIVSHFTSLADLTQKPHTPYDLPTSLTPQTSVLGDVLFSAEVDDGLDQLLAEWSIFKKSGLFGTGPKAREHPLFKKMSTLQIPLLLAGRFDGATQEIKQSVTDYMNGWRYEQGLIYEKGEMFEHYLRRVIRHILDLQK